MEHQYYAQAAGSMHVGPLPLAHTASPPSSEGGSHHEGGARGVGSPGDMMLDIDWVRIHGLHVLVGIVLTCGVL